MLDFFLVIEREQSSFFIRFNSHRRNCIQNEMDITLLSVGICSLNAAIWVLALNNTVAPHTASLPPPQPPPPTAYIICKQ